MGSQVNPWKIRIRRSKQKSGLQKNQISLSY